MDMLRDKEDIKMAQIELLKMENILLQRENILGRIKNRIDASDANITQRHRNRNYPEWSYPYLKYKMK